MARSIWTGAISFGLVTVPVKLYSAVNRKTVRFHQLSAKSHHRIAQKRVDAQSDKEVPYEEIVKGFEIAPDRYVVVEPGELDALQPEKTKTLELDIAKQLVSSLAGDFDPDRYRDTYREEVLQLIQRKAQGDEVAVAPPAEEVRAPAPDLMSALKASLDAVQAQDAEAAT